MKTVTGNQPTNQQTKMRWNSFYAFFIWFRSFKRAETLLSTIKWLKTTLKRAHYLCTFLFLYCRSGAFLFLDYKLSNGNPKHRGRDEKAVDNNKNERKMKYEIIIRYTFIYILIGLLQMLRNKRGKKDGKLYLECFKNRLSTTNIVAIVTGNSVVKTQNVKIHCVDLLCFSLYHTHTLSLYLAFSFVAWSFSVVLCESSVISIRRPVDFGIIARFLCVWLHTASASNTWSV